MKKLVTTFIAVVISLALTACVSLPEGVQPIDGFDVERYSGRWYEIARLDNRFERGLSRVTATYGQRSDGGIDVVNQGYRAGESESKKAIGKAYSVGDADTAHLKVSFFGPFYASYVVFHLDEEYRYAFVSGNSRDYLWLLSRTPKVDQSVKDLFIKKAEALGFDLGKLVWVDQ